MGTVDFLNFSQSFITGRERVEKEGEGRRGIEQRKRGRLFVRN